MKAMSVTQFLMKMDMFFLSRKILKAIKHLKEQCVKSIDFEWVNRYLVDKI